MKKEKKRKAQADLGFRCLHEASFILLNLMTPNELISTVYKLRFNVQSNGDCAEAVSRSYILRRCDSSDMDYKIWGIISKRK